MRKLLSIVLISAFIFALIPKTGISAENKPIFGDNIDWTLDEKGSLILSGEGVLGKFIQTETETFTVYPDWLSFSIKIKRLIIESGITKLDKLACFGYTNMTNVIIPDTVTKIGEYAFSDCHNLQKIVIPHSVEEIGTGVFESCVHLENAVLSNNISDIPERAFSGCSLLENIYIPKSVTYIGEAAFNNPLLAPTFNIYYEGTKEDWNSIEIADNNKNLFDCRVICNSKQIPAIEILSCQDNTWQLFACEI